VDGLEKGRICCPCRELNHDSSVVHSVAYSSSRHTDHALPAVINGFGENTIAAKTDAESICPLMGKVGLKIIRDGIRCMSVSHQQNADWRHNTQICGNHGRVVDGRN
jgi:hypothetical protein